MPIPFLPDVKSIAVVGASRNPKKWGHKVFKALLQYSDVTTYPVNPNAETIEGRKAYSSIEVLPEVPELVITVVPPTISEKVVTQAKKLGVNRIWFQPGSESEKAKETAKQANIQVFSNACMVVSSQKGEVSPPENPRE
ncbi:MAG: CoA-binding protein [Candidatus Korarchaeota archaeon]|nr:CoA-binding protein [Candidatus Korarchaeota archaeon]NIU85506.1 CoA-binding protein [Candidatus Thorarchaeota archaeon]NIW15623.1 CoA-binding protein [Candidatus Thorarchaeota archaeon]NIW53554.1 CoA-binding protein [Candidatus Korarchaeota archaeon]